MGKKLNLLLFSGDYDKALAALILANSAAEMGAQVTIFCAFWGLLLVRDPEKMTLEDKSSYEKLFGIVASKGPENLSLSKMDMAGAGKMMLKKMMEDAGAPSVSELLKEAIKRGVKFYGCKLSMEVMGFKDEEMIPGFKVMEAKDYLKDAFDSDIQLFI